ncbi:MAG: putative gluconolactonase, partial [Rhodoferax sp.]|nr:putative gluconolactonase [Rhodoferax sp.]
MNMPWYDPPRQGPRTGRRETSLSEQQMHPANGAERANPISTGDPHAQGVAQCAWSANAKLGEGALWSPRTQSLWWVDILGRRLHRFKPADLARQTWSFDEEISAVAERADATGLVITLRRGFADFDPETPGARPV